MAKFQFWTKSLSGANFHGEAEGTNFIEAAATKFGKLDTDKGLVKISNGKPMVDGVTLHPTEQEAVEAESDVIEPSSLVDSGADAGDTKTSEEPLGTFSALRSDLEASKQEKAITAQDSPAAFDGQKIEAGAIQDEPVFNAGNGTPTNDQQKEGDLPDQGTDVVSENPATLSSLSQNEVKAEELPTGPGNVDEFAAKDRV